MFGDARVFYRATSRNWVFTIALASTVRQHSREELAVSDGLKFPGVSVPGTLTVDGVSQGSCCCGCNTDLAP